MSEVTTPIGTIEWAFFKEPTKERTITLKDGKKIDIKPQYKATLVLSKEDALSFNAPILEKLKTFAAAAIKGKFKTSETGDAVPLEISDIQFKLPAKPTQTEGGAVIWKIEASRDHKYTDKKTNTEVVNPPIPVFSTEKGEDGKFKAVDATVGNGSQGVLRLEMSEPSIKERTVRCTVRLLRAQIHSLVEYTKTSQDSDSF